MYGLKKLRQTLKRNKSTRNNKSLNEVYIYTPLPNHKNGYIIEYRHPNFSEMFYYKYKENIDGTLTKYGYLVCDYHNRNVKEEIDYKSLLGSKDKECIFYQTVADKIQIALEKRWMDELREKGKMKISAYEDGNEWSDLMQHNNSCFISDNIQRRRVSEILNNVDLSSKDEPNFPHTNNSRVFPSLSSIHQLSKENGGKEENNNYYELYTPPLSPKTPPSSPIENYTNVAPKSLLNMNIRQRDKNKEKKYQEERRQPKDKVKKLAHLTHPKFSNAPMVHTYDPEDSLVEKNCRCAYCLVDLVNDYDDYFE